MDVFEIVGIAVLAFLLPAAGAGAANQINSCTTVSSPGDYILTASIINSGASSCINITSSDVLLDGSGFTIGGVISEIQTGGVYVYNPTTALTNVTVRNLKVTDWYYGYLLQ